MRKPKICLRSTFRASSRSDWAFVPLRKVRKPLAPRTSLDSVCDVAALVGHLFLRVVFDPSCESMGKEGLALFRFMDGKTWK